MARTPSCSRLPTSGCGSHVTVCRIPRNRFGLAAWSASNTGSTRSPRFRLAWPTMAAAARQGPYTPLALSGGQPLDELDLPHRPQLHRPIRAIHGSCLDKHGRTHVVAAVHVGDQLVQQIPLVGQPLRPKVPEVMVGIADRESPALRSVPGSGPASHCRRTASCHLRCRMSRSRLTNRGRSQ